MADEFDIYKYIEGLTGFVFDKTVIERIALDRGVSEVTSYDELTQRDKDLLRADLLYTAYCSPNMMANHTHQHGSYSKTVGAQTINRDELYQIFMGIYKKYGEDELLDGIAGRVKWIDEGKFF
jgi:hypothetical protein